MIQVHYFRINKYATRRLHTALPQGHTIGNRDRKICVQETPARHIAMHRHILHQIPRAHTAGWLQLFLATAQKNHFVGFELGLNWV
jgi:hypothetical protein